MLAVLSLLVACNEPAPPPPKPEPEDFDAAPPGGDLAPPEVDPGDLITNRAPVVKGIRIQPDTVRTTDTLLAVVEAMDPEDDRLDLDYTWVINGTTRYDLATERISPDNTSKGDEVHFIVEVQDGQNTTEKESPKVTIRNSPPEFVGDPRMTGQLDGFTLKATDPDDDELTFSISGQPAGMTIHPTMGRIEYKGSPDEEGGQYQVKITVDDGDGGTATWGFGIEVSPGSAAAKRAKEAAEAAGEGG